MIGKTILHYNTLEMLGEGGMGVVYKDEGTKLKRLVAIKFLPRKISTSDEERERFKIEAQAAVALNHPNICNICASDKVIEQTEKSDETLVTGTGRSRKANLDFSEGREEMSHDNKT